MLLFLTRLVFVLEIIVLYFGIAMGLILQIWGYMNGYRIALTCLIIGLLLMLFKEFLYTLDDEWDDMK